VFGRNSFSSTLTVAHVQDLSMATQSESAMAGWPLEQMRHDSADDTGRTPPRPLAWCSMSWPENRIVPWAETRAEGKEPSDGGIHLKTVAFATDLLHNASGKAEIVLALAKETLAKV
jgi:hypothetical protein